MSQISIVKLCTKITPLLLVLLLVAACKKNDAPETIDLSTNWRFSPDENNIGKSEKWYSVDFDDSQWLILDAGNRWENLGYSDLDGGGRGERPKFAARKCGSTPCKI